VVAVSLSSSLAGLEKAVSGQMGANCTNLELGVVNPYC
jgi:hypothetical protein